MKKNLFAILLFLQVIILSSTVLAGVTNPLPTELQLLKGESGRFKFQIQNVNRPYAINCNFELEDSSVLDLKFDDDNAVVDASVVKEFYGSVNVPSNINLGQYTQNFCVKCSPISTSEGASVNIDSCGLPVTVNVVASKSKENMTIPGAPFNYMFLVLILVVVIVIALALYFHKKSNKKHSLPAKKKKK